MNTKSILVEPNRLLFLIEGRKDDKGHDYFILSVGSVKFKFCKIESILDLLNSNSCGYVGK